MQTMDGGVYDLRSGGMSTHLLRVDGGSFTLNLRAENALDNVHKFPLTQVPEPISG